jgi:hypothetical protein
MVDLAIAANFVRELTEEQFAEQRRARRRGTPAGRGANGAGPAGRAPDRADGDAAPRPASGTRRGGGFGTTRVGRTLSRLAQVRG